MGTLQSSGAISLKEVASEFGDTAPHSLKDFYKNGGIVPSQISGSASTSAPATDGTQNNFAVSGLEVKRFTRQTPTFDDGSDVSQATLIADKYYNVKFSYSRSVTIIGVTNQQYNGQNNEMCVVASRNPQPQLNVTSDRAETNVSVSSGETGSGSSNPNTNRVVDFFVDGVNVGNFAPSGQTLPSTQIGQYHRHPSGAQNDGGTFWGNCSDFVRSLALGVNITLQGYVTADTTLTLAKSGNTGTPSAITSANQGDTFYYLWTNGTGGDVTVEGTTISSGDQIVSPDGSNNFSVSYTNAQVNGNIPSSGQIKLKDFYGATGS